MMSCSDARALSLEISLPTSWTIVARACWPARMAASSDLTCSGSDRISTLRIRRAVCSTAPSQRLASIREGVRLLVNTSIFCCIPSRPLRPIAEPTINMKIIMPNAIVSRAETLIRSASVNGLERLILSNMTCPWERLFNDGFVDQRHVCARDELFDVQQDQHLPVQRAQSRDVSGIEDGGGEFRRRPDRFARQDDNIRDRIDHHANHPSCHVQDDRDSELGIAHGAERELEAQVQDRHDHPAQVDHTL